MRQSEIERKAFLMVIVAGLVSGLVALGGHAAITRQLSSPPAVESAPAR